ncbi:MAG: HIT family protein [SAR324 cluster bacterium]|nr:HIT family protein [SAR324 cluster bacterium]
MDESNLKGFTLDSRLEEGLTYLGELDLCQVRLMPDSECPWVVLIPKRPDVKEIHQLSPNHQQTLMKEIAHYSSLLEGLFTPDKINVGALGNMVPQLHIHIIARYKSDRAWPGPIWGIDGPTDKQFIAETFAALKARG